MDFRKPLICINCSNEMKGGGGQHSARGVTTWRSCDCGLKALLYSIDDNYTMEARILPKEKENLMEKYLSLFTLSNIKVLNYWAITNKYHDEGEDWILAQTDIGLIEMGWRKRVINIDWSHTGIRFLFEDDVTKDETFIHAYGYDKAVHYLTDLKLSKSK